MLKLLIVDDERQIRLGLEKTIPWKDIGIDQVFTAQNGAEGLRQYHAHSPQIVLADIKMPGMSGLEMCEKIKAHNKSTCVFLLSGYVNTAFARQAISAGVTEYFLKPVDVEQLLQKIGSVTKELLTSRDGGQKQNLQPLFETNVPPSPQLLSSLGLPEGGCAVACVLLKLYSGDCFSRAGHMRALAERLTLDLNRRRIATVGQELFSDSESVTQILFAACGREYRFLCDLLYAAAGNHAQLKRKGEELIIAVGMEEEVSKTHYAYKKAESAMRYGFYYGPDSVIEFKNIEQVREPNLEALGNGIQDCRAETLQELENTLSYCSAAQIDGVKSLAARFISHAQGELSLLSTLFGARYIEEVFSCMRACCREEEGQNSLLSAKARAYIDAHYMQEISVEGLSELLGKSANYISHIFKKELGISIVKYTNALRMKKAGELLTKTNLTVSEIAAAVGYSNYNYFTRIFKAVYKQTPAEYRREKL